jgi:histidine phosphotransfer protein HptB
MNIKELSENLGLEEDEYIEMLDLFFASGGTDIARIEQALKESSAKRVHEAAHSLKGSAGSLCLDSIFELARIIDDKARRGSLDGLDELSQELRREYDRLVTAVQRPDRT